MPAPLLLRLRALTALATTAIKGGWMPDPVAQLDKPHGERLARNAMRIACKPGDRSIRTQDRFLMFSRLTRRADESMDEMVREIAKVLVRVDRRTPRPNAEP